MGQELVDVLLVVALDEEGDDEVRPQCPGQCGEVADEAARDPRADVVHAVQGDGRQHEHLQQHGCG